MIVAVCWSRSSALINLFSLKLILLGPPIQFSANVFNAGFHQSNLSLQFFAFLFESVHLIKCLLELVLKFHSSAFGISFAHFQQLSCSGPVLTFLIDHPHCDGHQPWIIILQREPMSYQSLQYHFNFCPIPVLPLV